MAIIKRKTSDVAGLEQKRLELAAALERAELEHTEARVAIASLASREAAVFAGDEDAALERDQASARTRLEDARADLARLRRIAPEIDRRIVEAHEAEMAEQIAKARTALERALAERGKASAAFAAAVPTREHQELVQARAKVELFRRAYVEAGGDDEPEADEPVWPDAATAVAGTLQEGPVQPSATAAAKAERARRERENSDRQQVRLAVEYRLGGQPAEMVLHRFPERLHAEIEERVAQARAARRRERERVSA